MAGTEGQLSDIFAGMGLPVAIFNQQRELTRANDFFCTTFDLDPDWSLNPHPILASEFIADGEYVSEFDNNFISALNLPNHNPISRIVRLACKTAGGREFNAEAMLASSGSNLIMLVRDVSHQVLYEQQQLLARSKTEQQQTMEAIGGLAAGFAHEFNNILTGINIQMQLLQQKRPGDEQVQETGAKVVKAVSRGASVLGKFLETISYPLKQAEAFTISDLKTGIETWMNGNFPDREINISALAEERGLNHHRDAIELVIHEVLANALEATGEKGSVFINLAPDRRMFHIEITDSGIGMDMEQQRRMFQPYFTTKDFGNSSGLGLTRVFSILNSLEGDISVNSTLGGGTNVKIEIPLELASIQ